MAEDCIRWEHTGDYGAWSPRSGFRVAREHSPAPGRRSWSLSWKKPDGGYWFVRHFGTKREAQHCAEDILRIRYGLVTREHVEGRYDIDLTSYLDRPPEVAE